MELRILGSRAFKILTSAVQVSKRRVPQTTEKQKSEMQRFFFNITFVILLQWFFARYKNIRPINFNRDLLFAAQRFVVQRNLMINQFRSYYLKNNTVDLMLLTFSM
jgi:hypothetical protein